MGCVLAQNREHGIMKNERPKIYPTSYYFEKIGLLNVRERVPKWLVREGDPTEFRQGEGDPYLKLG